jgi:hypothetical protein
MMEQNKNLNRYDRTHQEACATRIDSRAAKSGSANAKRDSPQINCPQIELLGYIKKLTSDPSHPLSVGEGV